MLHVAGIGHQRDDEPPVFLVEQFELAGIEVEDGDAGAHAGGHAAGVRAGISGADDRHAAGHRPRNAAQQNAGAAVLALEKVGADLDREPPGDLRHRLEQGQAGIGPLDRFVRDAQHALFDEHAGEFASGGQMQIGEQRLPGLQQAVLAGQRLLDLEHELRLAPHGLRALHQSRAGGGILRIGKTSGPARALLHEDLSAEFHAAPAKVGCHRDAGFAILDFFRNAYRHDLIMQRPADWQLAARGPFRRRRRCAAAHARRQCAEVRIYYGDRLVQRLDLKLHRCRVND
jgi:hypothetical protein